MAVSPTILCLASYEKGADFLIAAKRRGCTVILLTLVELQDVGWPRESIDQIYFMPTLTDLPAVINGVGYLARAQRIDRIMALDEYDVLTAAALREHLRLPGPGESATRYLRDKLAMRMRAAEHGVPVPDFVPAFNDRDVQEYMDRVPSPWLIKPRAEASTIGITRVETQGEMWARLTDLGDRRSFCLIERFVPGDVFHVDAITAGGQVVFAVSSKYGRPPLEIFHQGGIALTRLLTRDSPDDKAVRELNLRTLAALRPADGVTHLEAIKAHADGHFYFLEVAARVGGAHIHKVIEYATGINLWAEWATIESLAPGERYMLPPHRSAYAGVLIALARQEWPDTSGYNDPEIVWRMQQAHHVGFILCSESAERLEALLQDYSRRISDDFLATLPPYAERPPALH